MWTNAGVTQSISWVLLYGVLTKGAHERHRQAPCVCRLPRGDVRRSRSPAPAGSWLLSPLSNVNSASANRIQSMNKNALSAIKMEKKSIFILTTSIFYILTNQKVVFLSSQSGKTFLRNTNT